MYTSCMDVQVVAGDGTSAASPGVAAAVSPAVAAPAADTPSTDDPRPKRITRTRRHTRTITGARKTVTERITRDAFAALPTNIPADDVTIETIRVEKFITITRTAT
jgi:hypothetical protein